MSTAPHAPPAKPYVLDSLEHELLGRFAARRDPVSLAEVNEGLLPHWQATRLPALVNAGYLAPDGGECGRGEPRYRVTDSGRAALGKRPAPLHYTGSKQTKRSA